MRLFLAIVPPDPVRASLGGLVARNAPRFPGVRWAAPESFHVTVAFLGEVRAGDVGPLKDVLGPLLRGRSPFTLAFDHIGAAPQREGRPPDILWAAYAPTPAFAALSDSVFDVAAPFQSDPPPRLSPLPHVTLARSGKEHCPDPALLGRPEDLPATIDAAACTLFSSEPGKPGMHYVALDRFPFHDVP